MALQASALTDGRKTLRGDKLVPAWLHSLACAAAGVPATGIVIAPDAQVTLEPPAAEDARQQLQALLHTWGTVMAADEPWPTAVRTGLAWLADPPSAAKVYDGETGQGGERPWREAEEPCLARFFPDFDALQASPHFADLTERLYAPLRHALQTQVRWTRLGELAPGGDDD